MAKDNKSPTNPTAIFLAIITTIIWIIGIFTGIIYGLLIKDSLLLAIIFWVSSLLSGSIFLGFAEIIQLLTDIKNK